MKNIWSYVTYLTSLLTLSPVNQDDVSQQQVLGTHDTNIVAIHNDVTVVNVAAPAVSSKIGTSNSKADAPVIHLPGPIFAPRTRKLRWAGSDFECDYTAMEGWELCPGNRSCWLRKSGVDNPGPADIYDIGTDYETRWPTGIVRNYTLVVEDGQWNADGFWAKDAKLINGTYPGPLIQACWGDTVNVKVINKLRHNGTAIHFHGIRQLNSMHMDGVPGITQCPIAPDDYYYYTFKVTQFGDSWYHSHYSVQYADGMLGPVTLHGPTSAHWDENKAPILMSDWFHNSAFQVIHGKVPGYPTILLNGTGDVTSYQYGDPPIKIAPNAPIPPKFTLTFDKAENSPGGKPKKYLLRLINTSFTTTFAFSIDGHKLTVVGTDFVPVKALENKTYLQIGIGQRYTVIVEAKPDFSSGIWTSDKDNFWIRTSVVACFNVNAIGLDGYNKTGILRYDPTSVFYPSSPQWPSPPEICRDEQGFEPVLKWNIPKTIPANGKNKNTTFGQEFSAYLGRGEPKTYPLSSWSFMPDPDVAHRWNPMQVDYHDPFFLRLWDFNQSNWAPKWMVVPADYTKDDWVFLALTGMGARSGAPNGTVAAAHPIHLHGHDFAVLHLAENQNFDPTFKNFNFDNPLRRDVVLLPNKGWVVIAFKTDNPGSWIVHCHIAFHASEGLGFQINERQKDANAMWENNVPLNKYDRTIIEATRVCRRWKDFEDDCTRHWPGRNDTYNCWPACNINKTNERMYACPEIAQIKDHIFQDDSGV